MTDLELAKALLAADLTPLRIAKLRRHLALDATARGPLDTAKTERVLTHIAAIRDDDTAALVRKGLGA